MTGDRNLRRQLIRDAVAENVAVRAGELPPRAAPRAPRRGGRRTALAAAALLALVTAVGLVALRAASPAAKETASPAVRGAASPAAGSGPAATVPTPEPRFAAPTPIGSEVLPLVVRRVVIDPGHGGEDTGATTDRGQPPRLSEKELTLDIARRLEEKLGEAGFEVLLTRRDDRGLSLRERAAIANSARADLFVSIHVNWISHPAVLGVETYHLGPTDDPELAELTRRENRDSGYTLADLRQLLDGIYADVRQDESRQLAAHVQHALYGMLLPESPKLVDRGVKTAPFVVLVATEMPAILAEVSCLSNREEARRLARPRYREHIARALYRGIEKYAHDVGQTEEKGS